MIKNMRAIDFNLWMTLIAKTRTCIMGADMRKYVVVDKEQVLPEYPRDLTKFKKPSIIIQKVATETRDTCFGRGFLGQTYDQELAAYVDVHSKMHNITFQFDSFGDTNTQNALLTSAIMDEVLGMSRDIPILDFMADMKKPHVVGVAKLGSDIDVIPLNSNPNNDYRTAIRGYFDVVQTIVPEQEFIDLTKWMKISQKVIL